MPDPEKNITKHYSLKKITRKIFGTRRYSLIKFYKIFFDYLIKKDYDKINQFWIRFLPDNAVIIDIGANMGQCMMRFSKNSTFSLVSIEPVSSTFQYLTKARKLLGRRNVILINCAIGSKNEEKTIYIPVTDRNVRLDTQATLDKHLLDEKKIQYDEEIIIVNTLQKIIESTGLSRVDLIKIDAEGNESEILRSSLEILSRFSPVLSLETGYRSDFLKDVYSLGYKPYYIENLKLIKAEQLVHKKQPGNLVLIKNRDKS